jgi:hypothetical protein
MIPMQVKNTGLMILALLLAACSRQPTNSDGNGPGNADGFGGREDPATAPEFGSPSGDASTEGTASSSEGQAGSELPRK